MKMTKNEKRILKCVIANGSVKSGYEVAKFSNASVMNDHKYKNDFASLEKKGLICRDKNGAYFPDGKIKACLDNPLLSLIFKADAEMMINMMFSNKKLTFNEWFEELNVFLATLQAQGISDKFRENTDEKLKEIDTDVSMQALEIRKAKERTA